MAHKIGLVELTMRKEDGTLLSRLEMEKQLREESIHHRRLRATKLGLSTKIAQHMLPISVTHWLLDHWVANGTITGELLGIRSEFDADDNKDYLRQLTQRLVLFIEYGLAVTPNPGEGIDMTFTGQPPGFPPMPPIANGQQGNPSFAPPPPPQMPGMQSAPQYPQGAIPGFPPGMPTMPGMPQMPQPPMPPQPPQPQAPPQQFAPPIPQQQGFPTMMPPMPQQQAVPQQQPPQQQFAPPQGVPTKADPTRQWNQAGKRDTGEQRTRRTKEELAEDAAYEQWVKSGGDPNVGAVQQAPQQQAPQQQMPQPQQAPVMHQQVPQQMIAPPNPFGNVAPPQFPMPTGNPVPAQPTVVHATSSTQAPGVSKDDFDKLMSRISLLEKGIAHLIRIAHQKQGECDLYLVLTELVGIRP